MWRIARVDLGLTDADFWELTPRLFFILHGQFLESEKRHDMRWANWFALYANAHRDPAKQPKAWTAQDFMPGEGPRRKLSRDKPVWLLNEAERAEVLADNLAMLSLVKERWNQ